MTDTRLSPERASRGLDFGPKRFVSAGLLVAGLAIAGAGIAIVGRGGLETFRTAPPPSPGYLLLGLAFALADLSVGGFRLWVLAHRIALGNASRGGGAAEESRWLVQEILDRVPVPL